MISVKFKRFSENARVPAYAHATDSGADLYAANPVLIWPGDTQVVWTDVGVELPDGYEAPVRPRSGLSAKGVLVAFGTVDSGYRGSIGVTMTNTGRDPYTVTRGDRIAQLVVAPVARVSFEESEELAASARGDGGYGSSGR